MHIAVGAHAIHDFAQRRIGVGVPFTWLGRTLLADVKLRISPLRYGQRLARRDRLCDRGVNHRCGGGRHRFTRWSPARAITKRPPWTGWRTYASGRAAPLRFPRQAARGSSPRRRSWPDAAPSWEATPRGAPASP